MADFSITPRQGLVVYFNNRRVVRRIGRYGRMVYVSKHDHYAILYVNKDQSDNISAKLNELHQVRKVVPVYWHDLDPTVSDLESTGLYKKHDEDNN